MPTPVVCSKCSASLNVPDEMLGNYLRCSKCGDTFLALAQPSLRPRPIVTTPKATATSSSSELKPVKIVSKSEHRLVCGFMTLWLAFCWLLPLFLFSTASLQGIKDAEERRLWAHGTNIAFPAIVLFLAVLGWSLGGISYDLNVKHFGKFERGLANWRMAFCLPFIVVILLCWAGIPYLMFLGVVPLAAVFGGKATAKEAVVTVLAVLTVEIVLGLVMAYGLKWLKAWMVWCGAKEHRVVAKPGRR